jgi:hypothetical protein
MHQMLNRIVPPVAVLAEKTHPLNPDGALVIGMTTPDVSSPAWRTILPGGHVS